LSCNLIFAKRKSGEPDELSGFPLFAINLEEAMAD